jgi:hypothetical protein
MVENPLWEICERVAEVQALLHDHAECGKYTAVDVWLRRRKPCCRNPTCCGRCSMSATSRRTRRRPNEGRGASAPESLRLLAQRATLFDHLPGALGQSVAGSPPPLPARHDGLQHGVSPRILSAGAVQQNRLSNVNPTRPAQCKSPGRLSGALRISV